MLRFRCFPLSGGSHTFSIGTAGGRRARGQRGAPECPDHADSKVTRNGRYGSGEGRQRYRCDHSPCNDSCAVRRRFRHADCQGWHNFTPTLPRAHVTEGDQCDECLELRGIHRGERLVARWQRLNSREVARLISEMAGGMTYVRAGAMALEYAGIKLQAGKLRRADTPAPAPAQATQTTKKRRRATPSMKFAARVWHVGADLVEAFAPRIWEETERNLREHSAAIASAGFPRVWIADDKPYYTDVEGKKKLAGGYGVLVVAELDPLDQAVPWRAKPRLARAYPRINHVAYRLLFDEIGYEPDLVIADGSSAIAKALTLHYDGRVKTHRA